ncbi:MAG: ATP-grasp domain-containing protein [bacterium]
MTAIEDAIENQGHRVVHFEGDDTLPSALKKNPVDMVFNRVTGLRGLSKQSYVPSVLDLMNIPYTGSGVLAHALALNKSATKQILGYIGVPTPQFQVFRDPDERPSSRLRYPLIVKPLLGGSSVGIFKDSVVRSRKELRLAVDRVLNSFDQPALVEEYIYGRELTVGILGNREPAIMPILETESDVELEEPTFTHGAKIKEGYVTKKTRVAQLSKRRFEAIRRESIKVFKALRCRDYARVDIILSEDGTPYVFEANSMPGLYKEYSAFPEMARAAGMSYRDLITKILNLAIERYKAP